MICDFIGAKFSSPEAAVSAMKKIESSTPADYLSEQDSHPHPAIRVEYISKWKDDSRLAQEMTKEMALDIGGPDFRAAAPIYAEHGRL